MLKQTLLLLLLLPALVFANQVSKMQELEQYIQKLLDELDSPQDHQRDEAVEQLALLGEQVLGKIKEQYPQANYSQRRQMIRVVGQITTAASREFLFAALKDSDNGVRSQAAYELVQLSDQDRGILKQVEKMQVSSPEVQQTIDELVETLKYKFVEEELLRLISPQGGYGFYDGQFDELKRKLQKDAILPLLAIFVKEKYLYVHRELNHYNHETTRYKIRYLAGRALGDFQDLLGDLRSTVINSLRTLKYSDDQEVKEIAAYARYRLGDTTEFMTKINRMQAKIRMQPNNPDYYSQLAMLYLQINESEKGIENLEKAISLRPDYPLDYYNLACAYSYTNQTDKAIASLQNAIDHGYDDVGWMKKDKDLANIRQDPRFEDMVKQLEGKGQNP